MSQLKKKRENSIITPEISNVNFSELAAVRDSIADWFMTNRAEYFFRQDRNPYKVWISEVFLQQTRIESALRKLENFLNIFPDVESLAKASEDDVLAAFKGMGYYNRARNLRKGAIEILALKNGFPDTIESLKTISSIGDYTAAAIGSICFDIPQMVVDGNIKRIFARIFGIKTDINSRTFKNVLSRIGLEIFHNTNQKPGLINESLMEFGQKVCTAGSPNCSKCFIAIRCRANAIGLASKLPLIKTDKTLHKVVWRLCFLLKDNHVLVHKYEDSYFLKNQTGFPSEIEFQQAMSPIRTFVNPLESIWKNLLFIKGPEHRITNHKIQFFYALIHYHDLKIPIVLEEKGFQWIPMDSVDKYIISSGLQKTWDLFRKNSIARGGT